MRRIALLTALLCLAATGALAQDATKVAAATHKVILDNSRVRVLDVRVPPGAKVAMHSHPDYVAYALADFKVKFTFPDGKSVVVDGNAGEASWRPAETHAAENLGAKELHVLNIELKEAPPAASAAKK